MKQRKINNKQLCDVLYIKHKIVEILNEINRHVVPTLATILKVTLQWQ